VPSRPVLGSPSRPWPSYWAHHRAGSSPLVDALEERGILERRRNPTDRRLHALHLTEAGHQLLRRIGKAARAHNDAICRTLDPTERDQLRALLTRIADDHNLTPGVHPGYRNI